MSQGLQPNPPSLRRGEGLRRGKKNKQSFFGIIPLTNGSLKLTILAGRQMIG
jgi:hypothetical protein